MPFLLRDEEPLCEEALQAFGLWVSMTFYVCNARAVFGQLRILTMLPEQIGGL